MKKTFYFLLSFLIFAFWVLPFKAAEAALIIQAPKYIGLTNGLVGYWSFDGKDMAGVTAYDRSGNANNGTLTGGPARVQGKIGQGLSFDGSDDAVAMGVNAIGPDINGASAITVCGWVKLDTAPSDGAALFASFAGGGSTMIDIGFKSTLLAYVAGRSQTTDAYQQVNGVTAISLNTWAFVCGVWDYPNDKIFVYLNSILNNSGTVTFGATTYTHTNATVGSDSISFNDASTLVDGLIDDVRVYNRVLSADEIKRLYKIGATLKINTSINNDSLQKGLVGYWSFDGKDMASNPN